MRFHIIDGRLYVESTHEVWLLNDMGLDDPTQWTWQSMTPYIFEAILADNVFAPYKWVDGGDDEPS